MPETNFASIPAVKQYLQMAEACNVDYLPLLAQVGVDPDLLANNSARIPFSALEQLLRQIIPVSGDPLFGLHAAQYVQHNSYSVLGYISMNCATLGEVFTQMPVYEKIVGGIGSSSRAQSGDQTCLVFSCHFSDPLVRRHVTENVLASWDRFAQTYLQVGKAPRRVFFEHPAPQDPALQAIYRDTFNCEVLFDQPFSGTWMDEADLSVPIEQANEQLLKTLLDHAGDQLRELDVDLSLADKVKNMLRLMMSQKLPSRDRLAEELGMSSRTLQRKLEDEGTHYQEVLDTLRLEMATHFLARKEMSLDDIAIKLGYLETRSFYRGFKQWTGQTLGEFRKALLADIAAKSPPGLPSK